MYEAVVALADDLPCVALHNCANFFSVRQTVPDGERFFLAR
jgi:hypothetical protein